MRGMVKLARGPKVWQPIELTLGSSGHGNKPTLAWKDPGEPEGRFVASRRRPGLQVRGTPIPRLGTVSCKNMRDSCRLLRRVPV